MGQLLQRTVAASLGGFGAEAEAGGDFTESPAFTMMQEEHLAVRRGQGVQGFIHQRSEGIPKFTGGVEVGSLWLGVVEDPPLPAKLFVYDLEIHQPFRRQGLGRQALNAVEAWALDRGIRRLELNVFADNHEARKLYETSGMAVSEMTMGKDL